MLTVMAWLAGCASTAVPPRSAAIDTDAAIGARAAEIALGQIGVPYRYGGAGPTGFDCSGLVHYAYSSAGKAVPRTSVELWNRTAAVPRRALRPGDVLFFEIDGKMQHVGLYVGGDRFVHAPASGRTVSVATLGSAFYAQAYLGAGRPR